MARVYKSHQVQVEISPFIAGPIIEGSEDDRYLIPNNGLGRISVQNQEQIAEALEESSRIREAAEQEAADMIEEAKKNALQIEIDAYQQGKAEGYAAGREDAECSLESFFQLADNTVVQWEAAIRNTEEQVVELALAIVAHIIGQTTETDRNLVLRSVMQAMDHLAESPTVKIRVNPAEHDFVSHYWSETRGSTYRDRIWEVIADNQVSQGGCVLELENGRIDAQLETQLAEVSRALRLAGGFNDRAA